MSTDLTQQHHVKITVTGDCGHILWQGFCRIDEKYPFWCDECDAADFEADKRTDKYPWVLTTEIVPAPAEGPEAELCQCGHIARVHNVVGVLGRRGYCHECSPGQCKSFAPAEPAAPELRVRIHQHLRRYPDLTAFEIARALSISTPGGKPDQYRVRTALKAMKAEGEAASATTPKQAGTSRPATRWKAT